MASTATVTADGSAAAAAAAVTAPVANDLALVLFLWVDSALQLQLPSSTPRSVIPNPYARGFIPVAGLPPLIQHNKRNTLACEAPVHPSSEQHVRCNGGG